MAGKINERMREKGLLEHNHPTIRSAKNGHKTSGPELVRVKFNQTGMVRVVLRSISRSRPMKLYVRTLTILVAIIALVTPLARASGQAVGAARPFPDLQRVTADYPDDAERFIVFNLLYSWIGENTAGRQSKAAYESAARTLVPPVKFSSSTSSRGGTPRSSSDSTHGLTNASGTPVSSGQFWRSTIFRAFQ